MEFLEFGNVHSVLTPKEPISILAAAIIAVIMTGEKNGKDTCRIFLAGGAIVDVEAGYVELMDELDAIFSNQGTETNAIQPTTPRQPNDPIRPTAENDPELTPRKLGQIHSGTGEG